MSRPIKVAICVPSHRDWVAQFGVCLASLIQYAALRPWKQTGLLTALQFRSGSILPRVRTLLVEDAIASGADYLLFLDDDMVFPRHLLHRMLDAGKDVLGVNYMCKSASPRPTAQLERDGIPCLGLNSVVLTGLSEVAHLGTGALLLKTEIFKSLERPWFAYEYGDGPGGVTVQEDYYLCRRLRAAGHALWTDHDLSREVGHVGPVFFMPQHVTTSIEWHAPDGKTGVSTYTDYVKGNP